MKPPAKPTTMSSGGVVRVDAIVAAGSTDGGVRLVGWAVRMAGRRRTVASEMERMRDLELGGAECIVHQLLVVHRVNGIANVTLDAIRRSGDRDLRFTGLGFTHGYLLRSGRAGGTLCEGGEAGGGEGIGVVFADEVHHLFADDAAEVEAVAGVWAGDEAANLHGVLGEVGDLQAADLAVPLLALVDDALELERRGSTGIE